LAVLVAMHIGAVILHELRGYRVLRRMSWRSRVRQACGRIG
jgi:cytochrome b561